MHCITLQYTTGIVLVMIIVSRHTPQSVAVCCSVLHCNTLQAQDRDHCIRLFHSLATHCSTLQHSATDCSTQQHTVTHFDTLRLAATHCDTLQHTAAHCNTLQHTATHSVQHIATLCTSLQHTATHCNTLQHTRAHTTDHYHPTLPFPCNLLQQTATP